jgi:hypothetical protein
LRVFIIGNIYLSEERGQKSGGEVRRGSVPVKLCIAVQNPDEPAVIVFSVRRLREDTGPDAIAAAIQQMAPGSGSRRGI